MEWVDGRRGRQHRRTTGTVTATTPLHARLCGRLSASQYAKPGTAMSHYRPITRPLLAVFVPFWVGEMGKTWPAPQHTFRNGRAKCPIVRAKCPIPSLSQSQAHFVSISGCFAGFFAHFVSNLAILCLNLYLFQLGPYRAKCPNQSKSALSKRIHKRRSIVGTVLASLVGTSGIGRAKR